MNCSSLSLLGGACRYMVDRRCQISCMYAPIFDRETLQILGHCGLYFPNVYAGLALDSWNYCYGEQGPTV